MLHFAGNLDDYIFYKIGGLPAIVDFYNKWAVGRGLVGRFVLATYEDMWRRPRAVLRYLLDVLDVNNIDQMRLDAAVEFGQIANMRRIEKENALDDFRLRPY